MIFLIVKLFIVILIGLAIYKAVKAKKIDESIEFKMNRRSWIEFSFVYILNVFVLLSRPGAENEIFYILIGQVMIVLTFLHTKRYVFIGKKALYMLEHSFSIKDVRNVYYEKNVLHLSIRNTKTKVRLPVTDVEYLLERFSGKRFQ